MHLIMKFHLVPEFQEIFVLLSKIIKLKIFAISKTCLDSHISLGYGKNNFQLLLPPIEPKKKKI